MVMKCQNGCESELDSSRHFNELVQKINRLSSTNIEHDIMLRKGVTTEEIYEIGASAMDCSIMITFQRVDEPTDDLPKHMFCATTDDGKHYVAKISVFDLDPKPWSIHTKKFLKKTREALEAYRTYVDQAKVPDL